MPGMLLHISLSCTVKKHYHIRKSSHLTRSNDLGLILFPRTGARNFTATHPTYVNQKDCQMISRRQLIPLLLFLISIAQQAFTAPCAKTQNAQDRWVRTNIDLLVSK